MCIFQCDRLSFFAQLSGLNDHNCVLLLHSLMASCFWPRFCPKGAFSGWSEKFVVFLLCCVGVCVVWFVCLLYFPEVLYWISVTSFLIESVK
jgi:hypothetical protein